MTEKDKRTTPGLKFAVEHYLHFDVCEGEEANVTCRTIRLPKARRPRPCFIGAAPGADQHQIKSGAIYRYERALVDGDYWGNYSVCIECIEKWLIEVGVQPIESKE